MEGLQLFNFNGNEVRVSVDEHGEPWFVAKEIAAILGYSQTQAMTKLLDADEFISSKLDDMNMKSTIINEGGFYSAVLGSKRKEAKIFKKWVTTEVLPSIRKHGVYLSKQKTEEMLVSPDTIILLATQIKTEREEKETLKREAERLKYVNEQQSNELRISSSKAKYYDQVLDTPDLFTISTIANELGFRSPFALNTYLHEKGVLKKVGGVWLLTADFVGMGYTGPKTHKHTDSEGVEHSTILTCWTQKGREFIRRFYEANPPSKQMRILKPFTNTGQIGSGSTASPV